MASLQKLNKSSTFNKRFSIMLVKEETRSMDKRKQINSKYQRKTGYVFYRFRFNSKVSCIDETYLIHRSVHHTIDTIVSLTKFRCDSKRFSILPVIISQTQLLAQKSSFPQGFVFGGRHVRTYVHRFWRKARSRKEAKENES